MTNHSRLVFTAFFLLLGLATAQASPANEPRLRETQFAQRVVITELTRALSPSIRASREQRGPACRESGALELGVALLGVGQESTSAGLLDLLALRLDGAGAEELHCQVFSRGKRVLPALKRLDPARSHAWCVAVFASALKRELSGVVDVPAVQTSAVRACKDIRAAASAALAEIAANTGAQGNK